MLTELETKELKVRTQFNTAIYKLNSDDINSNWYMTDFTYQQYIGNQNRIRELIDRL